ncbi:RNA polymerase sigma factor [Flaviaesturariibacter amylovorans]|uniref:Sigma-70 family RNA polymerase sigma factor n=1 Tax=Flaviaesturariibacter amylovorans TaxID=1084520 RepID=A0ABP8G9Z4_9BACT
MSAKTTYPEGELVTLLRQKDEGAFSYLYEHYSGALYGVVRQVVADEELAQDVLQEVFVSIWRKIDSYDALKGRLFTWMLNVARNAAIDKVRSKGYQQSLRQTSLDVSESSHPAVRPGIDDYGLKKTLSRLKDEQRQLIDLSYYQGYTHDQIAKALNIPLGTVKTRLRTALSQLRTMLS